MPASKPFRLARAGEGHPAGVVRKLHRFERILRLKVFAVLGTKHFEALGLNASRVAVGQGQDHSPDTKRTAEPLDD
jgi:hypothetical protein